jgi:DNA-directed RNA polymerase subunit M/transcription elongation factor TFIIS
MKQRHCPACGSTLTLEIVDGWAMAICTKCSYRQPREDALRDVDEREGGQKKHEFTERA